MLKTSRKIVAIGVAVALAVGGSASAAFAAGPVTPVPQPNGSDQALYTLDGNTGEHIPAGTVLDWTYAVIGAPTKVDYDDTFPGSADTTEIRVFLSKRGEERTPSKWIGWTNGGFKPGTLEVLQPSIYPSSIINGAAQSVRTTGGQFSLGFAFLKNNALTVADAGVVFHYIDVQPGGKYTWEDPVEQATAPVTPPAGSEAGSIDIEATTIGTSVVDGVLSLSVPSAKAIIGNPKVVDNTSVSTGTLGAITVKDGRVVSRKGWGLTSSVTDFTNTADPTVKIDRKQLGISPKVVSTTGDVAGIVAGAAHLAGAEGTLTKFAQGAAGVLPGDTVLDADLKFVAPTGTAAGTYSSKLTLTLTSN